MGRVSHSHFLQESTSCSCIFCANGLFTQKSFRSCFGQLSLYALHSGGRSVLPSARFYAPEPLQFLPEKRHSWLSRKLLNVAGHGNENLEYWLSLKLIPR